MWGAVQGAGPIGQPYPGEEVKEAFIQSPIAFHQLIILQNYQERLKEKKLKEIKLKETFQKHPTKSFSLERYILGCFYFCWFGFFWFLCVFFGFLLFLFSWFLKYFSNSCILMQKY